MTKNRNDPWKKMRRVNGVLLEDRLIIKARTTGTCVECKKPYRTGNPIMRSSQEGWMHAHCISHTADSIHDSMKERRERLARERQERQQE